MFKFDIIKASLSNSINLDEKGGVVISGFDESDNVLFVKGVIFSDEPRKIILKNLFDKFVLPNKKIKTLVVDFVYDLKEIKNVQEVLKLDMLNNGFFLGDVKNEETGAFILPNTKGVSSFKDGYKLIKDKVKFSSSLVNVYTFKTKRFVLED